MPFITSCLLAEVKFKHQDQSIEFTSQPILIIPKGYFFPQNNLPHPGPYSSVSVDKFTSAIALLPHSTLLNRVHLKIPLEYHSIYFGLYENTCYSFPQCMMSMA